MKTILATNHPPLRAYSESTLVALRSEAGLATDIFSGSDILADAAADADAIFSSWGMPTLTAEEIAAHLPRVRAVFYAAGSVQAFARPFLEHGIRVY